VAAEQDRAGRRPLRNPRGDYYNSDLVVALKHLDLVGRELGVLLSEDPGKPAARTGLPDPAPEAPAYDVVERSEELGLALLRLRTTTDRAAAAVLATLGDRDRREAELGRTHLDRLLRGLRFHFRRTFAGWTPTIGKNRLVGSVEGGGRISHGDNGPPARVTAEFSPPRRAGTAGDRVRVGVLDTSVANNDWLLGGWTASGDGVLPARDEYPAVAGHATFIAGLVLRQAPACQVVVHRVLDNERGEADSWDVAVAIARIGRARVDVLNLSLVCFTEDGEPPLVLATAIDRLPPETLVVAAAGNHGTWQRPPTVEDDAYPDDVEDPLPDGPEDDPERQRRDPAYPAALDRVIAVGAVDAAGVRPSFTPRCAPWIDVVALGDEVVSTYLTGKVRISPDEAAEDFGGFAVWGGSSFSAALVSGAIAARTVPGSRSATEAWHDLEADLVDLPDPGAEPAECDPPRTGDPRPRWLRLTDLAAPDQRPDEVTAS